MESKKSRETQKNDIKKIEAQKRKNLDREIQQKEKQKREMQKKKKIIITVFCIIGILLMLVIGFFVGTLIYRCMVTSDEPKNGNVNTLYLENQLVSKEGDDILTVEIDEKNEENQANEQNTNTNQTTNTQKPKVVDAPYYIKVNYGANVVTVYKKDEAGKYTIPYKAFICSCR